jgi:hypothetical protein
MAAMKGRRLNVGVHTLTNGSITAMVRFIIIIKLGEVGLL